MCLIRESTGTWSPQRLRLSGNLAANTDYTGDGFATGREYEISKYRDPTEAYYGLADLLHYEYIKKESRVKIHLARPLSGIPAIPVGGGLRIPDGMLRAAKQGKGVALFEARFPTDNPIVLEIKRNDGTPVAEIPRTQF